MRNQSRILMLLILTTAPLTAGAATDDTVMVGQRVRITAPKVSEESFEGTVTAIGPQSVTIRSSADKRSHEFPLSIVEKVEVARGKTSRARAGAIAGGAWGLLAGQYQGNAATRFDKPSVGYVATAVVIGSGIGALVGSIFKTDNWVPVSKELVAVRVQPEPGRGVSVRLRLGF